MTVKEILAQMTLEEKAAILTGAESMLTTGVPRLNIAGKNLADGPHGVRSYVPGTNCTTLPSMCAIGATWSKAAAELAGKTMGLDCIHHNKQMILGPGLNIKRNALNGRNFEYVSEDPVLTGEIAGYVTKGMGDLAAMIAPRPLTVVNGVTDASFPIESAKEQVAIARRVYEVLGAGDKIAHVIGHEGHRFYKAPAWPVFDKMTGW